jgi:NADP-dependent aldehyde dehydrogenase
MNPVISTNPATSAQRTLEITETSVEEVGLLSAAADAAADQLATRLLTWRSALLRRIADELEVDAEHLIATADDETALGVPRLTGELRRTAFQFRFFADVVDDGAFLDATIDHATDSPMGPLPDLRRLRVPLGAVGVFGSSNFPFAFSVPGGDTASALAAGCAVVVKAHPAHPATSAACFAAMRRAATACGAPEGTIGLVYGLEAGVALVEASPITAVGFTGSVAAGRALWERANARAVPIPFFGELGAANPLVITEHAARDRGAEIGAGLAGSMTLGAGQFCTKPGLLFVPRGRAGDDVVAAMIEALNALGSFTMLSSGIASHFRAGSATIESTSGVTTLVRSDVGDEASATAQLYEVDAAHFASSAGAALRQECFGPVAVVVRYESATQLRDALEHSEPALTFSIFAVDGDENASWLVDVGAVHAGRVIVNGFPTGVGVSWSMQHGGPWPSTTAPAATSVGANAIERWLRPVTYQSVPDDLLPPPLREANPWAIPRRVDSVVTPT